MIALLASALLSAGAAAPATPPKWVSLKREGKIELFYDPASVQRRGAVVNVRTRTTIVDDPQGYGSFIVDQALDCAGQTATMLAAQGYDTGGKLYRAVTIPADKRETETIVQGDGYEPLYRKLCSGTRALAPAPKPLPPPVATPPGTKSQ